MSGKTCLYRHYNNNDDLLYISISLCAASRTGQHNLTAEWFGEIAGITVEYFPTKKEALIAEAKAIKKEKPRYNICHTKNRKTKKPSKTTVSVEAHTRFKGDLALKLKNDALNQKRSITNMIEFIVTIHYAND